MYKLNLIAIVSIVAAVSFVVGMSAPAAFAAQHENMTMTMDDNMTSMGGMTGDNATMTMDDNMTSMGGMTGDNATMTMDDNMSMSEMSNATSMTGQ